MITTSTAPIEASASKAPCIDPWYAMDRSPGDPCWEAFTTYMGVLIELGIDFCPPSTPWADGGNEPRDHPGQQTVCVRTHARAEHS